MMSEPALCDTREQVGHWDSLTTSLIKFGELFFPLELEYAAIPSGEAYIGNSKFTSFHLGVYEISRQLHWQIRRLGDPESEKRIDPKEPAKKIVRLATIEKNWPAVCAKLFAHKLLEDVHSLLQVSVMLNKEAAFVAKERSRQTPQPKPAKSKTGGAPRKWSELDKMLLGRFPSLGADARDLGKVVAAYNQNYGNRHGRQLATVKKAKERLAELRRNRANDGSNDTG